MEEKINEIIEDVKESSEEFSSTVSKIVKDYSEDLDSLMEDLRIVLTREEMPSDNTLERYYAELTNMLYFMSDKIEKLNVFSDISSAIAKNAYNKSYLEVSSEKDDKGKSLRTINENTSLATMNSSYEATVNTIYNHAYKNLKMKVDMGLEMVSTLKHILKKRINEVYASSQMKE